MLNATAGLGGLDQLQPVAAGLTVLVGNNFHHVPAFERRGQGRKLAVDLGSHAMGPHVAVDKEGKIQGRGAFGQLLHFSGGGKDVDFLFKEIETQRLHELARVRLLALALQQVAQPLELGHVLHGQSMVALLVHPVRGHAVFGQIVHFFGADLDFHPLALGADDRAVEALVSVGLGHGNIVFKAARHGLPQGVHQAEHGIAVPQFAHDDPEGDNIVHFVQGGALLLHLAVDTVSLLDAPEYPAGDAVALHDRLKLGDHFGYKLALHHLVFFEPVGDVGVHVGLEITEAEVLQFLLDAVQPQPVGQGSVNVHRFAGDGLLLVGLLELQGAHVVLAVGQFDDRHPNVVRHGQNHLTNIFSLGLLLGVEGHQADLGHPVHDVGHLFAELRVQFLDGGAGILHGVVQQPGCYGVLVKPHFGQGFGHRGGMHEVRIARQAQLSGMGRRRIFVGLAHHVGVGVGVVLQQRGDDVVCRGNSGRGPRRA